MQRGRHHQLLHLSLTAREPEVVQTSMDAVRRMLDAAQVLGAASALVIPGVATEDMAYESNGMKSSR